MDVGTFWQVFLRDRQ